MNIQTLEGFPVTDKRIFVRLDLNVPIRNGKITDDSRIRAVIPTLNYLLSKNASLVLASHLGRPKTDADKQKLSLAPVAIRLSELLDREVQFLTSSTGVAVEQSAKDLIPGEVLLLENVRFEKGETENDEKLAKFWASLADCYVNDAFGTCHRKHASVHAITKYLPSAAGILIQKELGVFNAILQDPLKPFIVILGGAKLSTKLTLVQSLLKVADKILIGGAMMFTFLKAKGLEVGISLVEDSFLEQAKELLKSEKIILPTDVIVSFSINDIDSKEMVSVEAMPRDKMGLDIGHQTQEEYTNLLAPAKCIFWNGPMGVSEIDAFSGGTKNIGITMAMSKARTIVGGGDSVAAVNRLGALQNMTHVYTGGGASLEYVEKRTLPGLEVLEIKK